MAKIMANSYEGGKKREEIKRRTVRESYTFQKNGAGGPSWGQCPVPSPLQNMGTEASTQRLSRSNILLGEARSIGTPPKS